MAHFAKIEDDGTVSQVIVVNNEDCGGGEFPESNAIGQEFIASIGLEGHWEQTSYGNNFRGTYAGIGYKFDKKKNIFIAPEIPDYSTN